jgi:hypothetical protein
MFRVRILGSYTSVDAYCACHDGLAYPELITQNLILSIMFS